MLARYFDIDACWNSNENAAYTCHMAAYGGAIAKMLDQVDAWMNKNRNEVVVLHFNRDYDKSEEPEKIGRLVCLNYYINYFIISYSLLLHYYIL